MKLLCKLFGHVPNYGVNNKPGTGYFKVIGETTDGIGCRHLFMQATCERCGDKYRIGNVHVPGRVKV